MEHFKLFKDIAQHGSISRGASLNGLSQSAASQQIQDLERSLDSMLLDRSTRPMTLTGAGRLYLDFCRDVLRRKEEFDAALARFRNTTEGTVRVASIYSVGLSELAQLEQEFLRRHPGADLAVEYLRPERVYEAVEADRADLGLVSYPESTKEIAALPWRKEEMAVAVSPFHHLARRATVFPEDLDGADFVAYDEDLPIRRDIDRFLREHHVHVNVTLHFDNLQMIKEAVAHGSGLSIVPARILTTEVVQGRIVAVPLRPALFRPLGIIHRRKKHFHSASQAFLELLQEKPVTASV